MTAVRMNAEWSNWSGSVVCHPRRIESPGSEAEIAAIVRRAAEAGQAVRVAGSGHSFSPLCATDDVLLSLDRWQGIESTDRGSVVDRAETGLTATIRAGTKIHDLGEPLRAAGMALENQGDVDVQALAGAIATGTHGTGRTLGSISTQVLGLRIVTAAGEVVECSREVEPDMFRAARVSLGALGVIVAVKLQLVPAYHLHERLWTAPIDACLARLNEHIAGNRHFEFFWYPATDLAHVKALNPTNRPPTDCQQTQRDPAAVANGKGERIDFSDRIFPTARENRFNEMEYSLPADAGPACFQDIRELMRAKHATVTWPVEYRTLAADDIDLSTAFGRETVTISIHQDARLDQREFFADAEAIFRHHDGRPHWGKMHSLRARDLRPLYPRWDAFHAIRRRLDPQGVFVNEHLRELLGDV